MRYGVYDEENKLFRKFWDKHEAQKFLQEGWKLIAKANPKVPKPTVETYGEARW
jgi:hypothetical protein